MITTREIVFWVFIIAVGLAGVTYQIVRDIRAFQHCICTEQSR